MRILGRLGKCLALIGIIVAAASWYDSTPQAPYLFGIRHTPAWLMMTVTVAGFALGLIPFVAKSPRRALLICTGTTLGILLLVTTALKVDAYVLRHRTARLLADTQSLEVGKSTLGDARRVFQTSGNTIGNGDCDRDNCRLNVFFVDSISSVSINRRPGDPLWDWIRLMKWAFRLLGGREAFVQAGFVVKDGRVWSKWFNLQVEAPREEGMQYRVHASVGSAWHVYPVREGMRHPILPPQTLTHPDFSVEQWITDRNPDTPAGVMRTSVISIEFLPSADPAIVRRLGDIDSSCLTRWHACRTPADLMPAAWAQYQADQSRVKR